MLIRLALASKELDECERASQEYRVAEDYVNTHLIPVREDRELAALMLPLTNSHDAYLDLALQESTVEGNGTPGANSGRNERSDEHHYRTSTELAVFAGIGEGVQEQKGFTQ